MRDIITTAKRLIACTLICCAGGAAWAQAVAGSESAAQNSIENLQVTLQGGSTIVKMTMRQPLAAVPASFSIANPARVAFDFPATANGLGRSSQQVNEGDLRSINIVEVSDRTRMVMNLRRNMPFEMRTEDKFLYITFAASTAGDAQSAPPSVTHFAEAKPQQSAQSIRDINFKRGKNGEGLVVVDLSDPNVGIDIRQLGTNLVVEFAKASLPENLRRRLDVTDFATPVTSVLTQPQGENVRVVISPRGMWEHNAYQSDNQFVIEVKQVVEDPNKLVQGSRGGYQGEKLSLNFQNVEVRAVLQVISDFTNLNVVVSDSVTGALTLRLKDVPWDQALDIILNTRGLDMRKNGNVIWIAPRDELAAKEKLNLESKQAISELEPTRTESFQLNYHKAKTVQDFLKSKEQTLLSKRGGVVIDERSNKLFITDTPSRLEEVRRVIAEIDVASRQVLIEARIVEASESFNKALGVRLGGSDMYGMAGPGGKVLGIPGVRFGLSPTANAAFINSVESIGSTGNPLSYVGGYLETGTIKRYASYGATTAPNALQFVNLPVANPTGSISLSLFNGEKTRMINLEISAQEADNKGKTITSPRILTADKAEALIEQGVQVPYLQATSSGATSVSFQKAVMSLKVTPNITPDGRIMLNLDINKDEPDYANVVGGSVPINTKHIKTDVLVENGGTVVIGGIFQQIESHQIQKVPVLGDLPYLGILFRNNTKSDQKTELLVFITPKIVADSLNLR
ncbi:MAG: type IV pilus secretin PilQ [Rhodocyclaceae bacterium]|nr:type IV pilus secretin PilQ [Rhodocyclaceae bacterium]